LALARYFTAGGGKFKNFFSPRVLFAAADPARLFQPAQAEELADGIPGAHRETVHSLHGHDGFLIETGQMEAVLRRFLAESEAEA